MKDLSIQAFVPIKLQSRRLHNKNFLRLGDRPLAYHIFKTLDNVDEIERVFCYTSQPQVLSFLPDRVELLQRPGSLDKDQVKANELFYYAVKNIQADIVVLCHATSPFVTSESIRKGIKAVASGIYDCAFSVKRAQTYCWYDKKPLNYNPVDMRQTQDLSPVFLETSGFYIFRRSDYIKYGTRIGKNPFMVEVDFRESIDIDYPEDFYLARNILNFSEGDIDFSRDSYFVDCVKKGFEYNKVQHLSFDLDGVLIDSLPVMELAWRGVQKETGINIPFSLYKQYIGFPFLDILDLIGVPPSLQHDVKNIYNNLSMQNHDKIKIYPGILQSLQKAKQYGFDISIVTSKTRERTEDIINNQLKGIEFDAIVTCDDVENKRGKPHPDSLLKACIEVEKDPIYSVYIGDMDSDRETALRAGVHFIHAAWGIGNLDNIKDIWFDNMRELVDFLVDAKVGELSGVVTTK